MVFEIVKSIHADDKGIVIIKPVREWDVDTFIRLMLEAFPEWKDKAIVCYGGYENAVAFH